MSAPKDTEHSDGGSCCECGGPHECHACPVFASCPIHPAPIPLCPSCVAGIGGANAGPDAPWKAAELGEECGAADCLAERCDVCNRTGKAARACRFEVCCSCWYGKPCDGSGRVRPSFRVKVKP